MVAWPRLRRDASRRRGSSPGPDGGVPVAPAHRVPDAPPFLAVRIAGRRVLLGRRGDGTIVAFDAACPHLGTSLRRAELTGDVVTCREHHHRYGLRDGRCLWPGTATDEVLTVHEADELDGRVWVRLRSEA